VATMDFKRTLKLFSTGDDVLYIKQLLFKLGYFDPKVKKVTNKTFGYDTKKAVGKFQDSNKEVDSKVDLDLDYKVGPKTWASIVNQYEAKILGTAFDTDLKVGMSGAGVLNMKNCLYKLKYLKVKPTHNKFGNDTKSAVELFQKSKNLNVTGIIDKKTWNAILASHKANEVYVEKKAPTNTLGYLKYEDYPNITKAHIDAINKDLASVSETRKKIVAECLKHVYDMDTNTKKPVALYIFGANLYDTAKKLYKATASYINKRAKELPSYFNGGRKEWMLEMVKQNPSIPCSDCSGLEIGVMRLFGIISPKTDMKADTMCSSSKSISIKKSELKPADWVGKPGHIATYVGAGLSAEFVGGAYGGQLTDINTRKAYNFVKKRVDTMDKWTKFRRPKLYD